MDGRTDGQTSGNSPLCPAGHRPFGAAAQKGIKLGSKDIATLYPAMLVGRSTSQLVDWSVPSFTGFTLPYTPFIVITILPHP